MPKWLQVRFHPLHPQILASGSLDQEVRLWDANTAECIISHHFCIFTNCPSLILFSKLLLLLVLNMLFFLNLLGSSLFVDFIGCFLTDRPIASIAFHANGEIIAVASGHRVVFILRSSRVVLNPMNYSLFWWVLNHGFVFCYGILCQLYIWHYNKKGEASSPVFVLKTRRSLRAVHFHPHAAPYLLTAEVNELMCFLLSIYPCYSAC